jgi:hypothetical protein
VSTRQPEDYFRKMKDFIEGRITERQTP